RPASTGGSPTCRRRHRGVEPHPHIENGEDRMNMSMELASPGAAGASNEPAAVAAAGAVHDLGNLIQLASSAIGIIGRSPEVREGRLAMLAASAHASLDRAGLLVRQALDRARRSPDPAQRARLADCLAEVDASIRGAVQTDNPPCLR